MHNSRNLKPINLKLAEQKGKTDNSIAIFQSIIDKTNGPKNSASI